MLKYILDTNIVIYTMKNKPDSVREKFKKQVLLSWSDHMPISVAMGMPQRA